MFLVATDANDGLYVIATNLEQTVDEYGASKFTLTPPPAVYPGVQMHEVSMILPVPSVNVFTTQLVQACEPVVVLYVLTAHNSHAPPFGPVYPATHEQLVLLSLCTSESANRLGHAVHAVCPGTSAYVFVAHGVHVPPAGP